MNGAVACNLQVQQLQQAGHGDLQPDLAEQYLRLCSAFLRRGHRLAPPSSAAASLAALTSLAESCVVTAAACCGSNHKRVCMAALSTLGAAVVVAGEDGPYAAGIREVVVSHGERLVSMLMRALLGPSPLPRVQKVGSATEFASIFGCHVQLQIATTLSPVQKQGLT